MTMPRYMRPVRWGDADKYLGPFTYAPRGEGNYNPWCLILKSAGEDEDWRVCTLRIGAFGRMLIIQLPAIIRPHRHKVYPGAAWDARIVERLGRDWYWHVDPREYGFWYSEGFLQLKLGRSTNDSSTDQSWSKFLPWTQWRHVRRSLYGLDGRPFYTVLDSEERLYRLNAPGDLWYERFKIVQSWEEMCPKRVFEFNDFDGERLQATTHLEQREWLFGTGWFKWLSWFRKPRLQSSLCISFSGEVGKRKGSWKGGTLGHSIEMGPDEMHEAAFRRYCEENNMAFVRDVSERV